MDNHFEWWEVADAIDCARQALVDENAELRERVSELEFKMRQLEHLFYGDGK